MEILYSKRINYAKIACYKNYCNLNEKEEPENDVFNSSKSCFLISPKRNNKTTKFFHSDEKFYCDVRSVFFKKNVSFYTEKDRHIKNHYNNPFSEITIYTQERKITRNGDKITIKLYKQERTRGLNCLFFKKVTRIVSVTIDINKGDIIFCDVYYNGKTYKTHEKKIRKNSFQQLYNLVDKRNIFYPSESFRFITTYYQYDKELYNDENLFINTLKNTLKIDFGDTNESIYVALLNKFIDIKKIKLPNNYDWRYLKLFYPGVKVLRKNNNNLYNSILDLLEIKSKSFIKFINKNPGVNIMFIGLISKLFGDDAGHYVNKLDATKFRLISDYTTGEAESYLNKTSFMSTLSRYPDLKTSNIDRKNIFSVLNNYNSKILYDTIIQIFDHINMINTLRNYGLNIHMKATNQNEFHEEHKDLSFKITQLKKEYIKERVYDNKLVENIESPINYDVHENNVNKNYEFNVTILKNELDYDNEGNYMHHCVASYFDSMSSIIISIRDSDSRDRVTCEFDIKSGELRQAKYFCNEKPPIQFNKAIEELENKIAQCAKLNILKPIQINAIKNSLFVQEDNKKELVNLFIP